MSHELRGVDTFIAGRLQADATLWTLIGGHYFTRPAPIGTAPPYVIASFLSSVDTNALGPRTRLFSRMTYLVRVITKDPNTATADAIADRIDDALVGVDGEVPAQGIFIGKVWRSEAIRYEETTPAGEVFQHTGGRYVFNVERLGG